MRALALLALLLASCELPSEYYASSSSAGNTVYEKRWGQLGGTRSSHRSDGSSEVNDYQVSFRDGAETATAVAIGMANVANTKSDNALTKSQGQQATAQQANARTPTIVPAQAVKPDTTVFPLVVPPSKPVVP
jgi:hypothetical protein